MSSARPVILLLGARGQLGRELSRSLAPLGDLRSLAKADLELTDEARVREAIRAARPAAIVNAAAYTRVDDAESEPAAAFAVNATVPRVLAEEASRSDGLLVHYSTDFVFDGRAPRPYRESDPPNPLGAYGASKLAGEQAVAAVGGRVLILRTAWLYGADAGFVSVVRRAAAGQSRLSFVHDQFGSPTWSRRVAWATAEILGRVAAGDRFALPAEAGGLYHLAGEGGTSRLGFARAILASLPGCQSVPVGPVPAAAFAAPAPRPAYSVLDSGAIREGFGVGIGPWRRDVSEALTARTADSKAGPMSSA